MSSDYDRWNPNAPVPGSREPVPGSRTPVPGSQGWAPPAPQDTPPPPDAWAALQQAMARIDQLEQQIAQQGQGVGADVPKLTRPTHDLYLADGTHVENTGAIPTHVHLPDDRILPVAFVVER